MPTSATMLTTPETLSWHRFGNCRTPWKRWRPQCTLLVPTLAGRSTPDCQQRKRGSDPQKTTSKHWERTLSDWSGPWHYASRSAPNGPHRGQHL
eukprot:3976357-Pyramimonas_sp.AAC.1